MTISDRLAHAMKHAHMTQAQLARACGVKPPSVNWWLSGNAKYLRGANLLKAAKVLGVRQQWLATGDGGMLPANNGAFGIELDDNPDYPAVRRVLFKLSAGVSGFGIEYPEGEKDAPLVFRRKWYESHGYEPEKLFAVKVSGDSMEDGLYSGDTVVVNTAQKQLKDGVVFAVNYEGELVIKRLVRNDGMWWLYSDNKDQRRWPPKKCHDNVFIIGEVIHKQSERI